MATTYVAQPIVTAQRKLHGDCLPREGCLGRVSVNRHLAKRVAVPKALSDFYGYSYTRHKLYIPRFRDRASFGSGRRPLRLL